LNEIGMVNFTGMLLRFFPAMPVGLIHGFGWALFLAAVVGLSIIWKISPHSTFGTLCWKPA